MQGLPEIPGPTNLITRTKDCFHSAVRAPCGQPKPFHASNKFFRPGKLSTICSASCSPGCPTLSVCFAERVGVSEQPLMLLPAVHCLTRVLVPVCDVDPAGERGMAPAATRCQKRVIEPQVGKLNRGPGAVGRQAGRFHARCRFLSHFAHHGPRSPVEIN